MVFSAHAHIGHASYAVTNVFKVGRYGVGIFFVLSAYLITELLLREAEKTGTISLKKFYIRRVLRIWPLYFLALGVAVLWGILTPYYHVSLGKALCFTLLLGNVYAALYGLGTAVIYPLWTLSIEEQFYAVIPTLMKTGGRKLLASISIVLLAVSYAVLFYFGRYRFVAGQFNSVVYNSFVEFQFFAAGVLLTIYLHSRVWKPSLVRRAFIFAASFAGLLACIGAFRLMSPEPRSAPILLSGYAVLLISTLGVFLSFLRIDLQALGLFKRLTYFGKISFGLYVYHAMLLVLVFREADTGSTFFQNHPLLGDAVALLGTVAVASLSYRYFEQPILSFKARFEVVRTGTV